MPAIMHRRLGHYLFLIAICLLSFFANLGGPSLWEVDEPRNAVAALEMMTSGNYVVPTFNAQLRVDKPALLYWLQIGAYRLVGVNEWGARLPSALAALITVLLAYELGRRLFQPSTGLLGGMIVATAPMVCGAARFANPDALLHCFTVLYLLIFWLGQRRPRWSWYMGLGVAAGLAILAKGLVGVVLPGAVTLIFMAWERRLGLLFKPLGLVGFAAMMLVAAPWYIWVGVETKANFLARFFMNHHVDRFLSPMENHGGFPGFYLVVLFLGLLPWTIYLGLSLWHGVWSAVSEPPRRWIGVWENAADRKGGPDGELVSRYRFLLVWIGVYLVFFSLAATKLPNYILPAAAPTSLLLARFLDRWRQGQLRLAAAWLYAGLGGLISLGLTISLGLAVAGGALVIPGLKMQVFPGLETWAFIGLVPVAAGVLAWLLLRRERKTAMVACLALGAWLLIGPLAGWGAALFNDFKAPSPLVNLAGALQKEQDIRIGEWQLGHLASLNFYCQRDIIHHQNQAEAIAFLHYPLQVFLFIPAREWEQLRGQLQIPWRELGRGQDLYRHGEVVVITNR